MTEFSLFQGLNKLLIMPQYQPESDRAYAEHLARMDIYDDAIYMSKFDHEGQLTHTFLVDPTDVAQAVSGLKIDSGYLPKNCLFWQEQSNRERLGVFVPPQVRRVKVGKKALTIPLPGLVFVGKGMNYRIYAVKADYPEPESPLFHAPCPNVGEAGVCAGNVKFPQAAAETIWQAVDVYFASGFNSHMVNGKSQAHPKDILKVWRTLDRDKVKNYPLDDLVEAGPFLRQVIINE